MEEEMEHYLPLSLIIYQYPVLDTDMQTPPLLPPQEDPFRFFGPNS